MKSAQDGWKAQRAELERNRDKLKQSLADLGFPDPSRVRDEDGDGLATSLVETLSPEQTLEAAQIADTDSQRSSSPIRWRRLWRAAGW